MTEDPSALRAVGAANIPAWLGIGRAIGGAIIFGLPMMMTMEMWWIGFYAQPLRLLALIVVSLPLFVGLCSIIGFEETSDVWDNIIDVFVAYTVAFITTASVLLVFGVFKNDTSADAIFSMILLQTVPATLGALLARSQIGKSTQTDNKGTRIDNRSQTSSDNQTDSTEKKCERSYENELIILVTGALFLAFNVAPTEEMILISYLMTPWHILALTIFTLLTMHLFSISHEQFSLDELRDFRMHRHVFFRFTLAGYLLAFIICLFMLWVFGRVDNESLGNLFNTVVVLNFPAGVGAAASRLII